MPIYQRFVEQAKTLQPSIRHDGYSVAMDGCGSWPWRVPHDHARDRHIRTLVDYPARSEVFPR